MSVIVDGKERRPEESATFFYIICVCLEAYS